MAKAAAEQSKTEAVQESAAEEGTYIAEVLDVCNKNGAGGDITLCRVLLRCNSRAIFRSVEGPIRVGDKLSLRECVRESRRSR